MIKESKNRENKKVVVAMSGGVDSSVAAALLKKQGYDVVGIFMRFWHETQINADKDADGRGSENSCCSEGAEAAARAVATKLNIPFYVLRFKKEFKKAVVDYFLAEEKRGRTPNPCVVCNKKIKFGMMFEKALGMGADFVATGHYARIRNGHKFWSSRRKPAPGANFRSLFQAKDKDKDQSYFLYGLNQKQLSRVLFPIGDYTKDDVYRLAKKWHFPYRQGESFDLCFVARDRESFIKRYLKLKTGKIVKFQPHPSPLLKKERGDDAVLGEHQGLPFYTIGQRKSLPLQQGPWWVVKKDKDKNILFVSNDEKDLYSKELLILQVNWISGQPPKLPAGVLVKIRYKSEMSLATIFPPDRGDKENLKFKIKNLKLIFNKPQRAITPGQSVVFYNNKDGEVLGGGVIES